MDKEFMNRVRSLAALPATVNKLYESILSDPEGAGRKLHHWHPPTDVFECDECFVIKMEVGGLRRDDQGDVADAEVLVEGETVIVRGRRADHCVHVKRAFFQMEIDYGRFERRVRFTSPFDRENIRAEYRDGFLEVIVPKRTPEQHEKRHVDIG